MKILFVISSGQSFSLKRTRNYPDTLVRSTCFKGLTYSHQFFNGLFSRHRWSTQRSNVNAETNEIQNLFDIRDRSVFLGFRVHFLFYRQTFISWQRRIQMSRLIRENSFISHQIWFDNEQRNLWLTSISRKINQTRLEWLFDVSFSMKSQDHSRTMSKTAKVTIDEARIVWKSHSEIKLMNTEEYARSSPSNIVFLSCQR